MDLAQCCRKFAYSVVPAEPKRGRFDESHRCAGCGRWIRITFEGHVVCRDEIASSPLEMEYVDEG